MYKNKELTRLQKATIVTTHSLYPALVVLINDNQLPYKKRIEFMEFILDRIEESINKDISRQNIFNIAMRYK